LLENLDKQLEELLQDESMFLSAYEQSKEVDPAFFRSKKVAGDPHVGFKVEFKGELVQGIGGPYRQFFSDISSELRSDVLVQVGESKNNNDSKHKKSLKLGIHEQ
jgi:hypothetical protein